MSLFFFIFWLVAFLLAYLYDTYIHARFRVVPFLCVLLASLFSVSVIVFHRTELAVVFGVVLLILSVAFVFFVRFHQDFTHATVITNLVSHQALDKVEKEAQSFFEWLDQDVVFLMRIYNEEQKIEEVLRDIYKRWFRQIIMVDDGSTDESVRKAMSTIGKLKGYKALLISHAMRRGWGAANKTLFACVKRYSDACLANWFVTFDADGQMLAEDVFTFLHSSDQRPDVNVFLGSRFVPDGKASNISAVRRCILAWSRLVTFVFSHIWVTDPHCWFRMMHKEIICQIQLKWDDMYYASEIIHTIQKKRWAYQEVPVHINYSAYSYQKGQRNRNSLRILTHFVYEHLLSR